MVHTVPHWIMQLADPLLTLVTVGTLSVTRCTEWIAEWTAQWMDWLAIGLESLKVMSASLY
jgi:hypothetical protein